MTATPTPTPQQFQNASADIVSGFGDMGGLGPIMVLLVYAVAALVAAQFLAPWLAQSSVLSRLGGGVVSTTVYAIKGLAASAVLAVAGLPVWFISQADSGTRTIAFRYVGYAVAGFAALVVLGWLADRAVSKFIEAHPDYDEWGDLFPDDDEDDLTDAEVAD